jgi:hypothetical protein
MRVDVFISKTEGDGVEISVVKHGLSSGAAHRYETVPIARAVLVKFGLDPELIDRQFRTLSEVPPSVLLRFPEAEIADEVLRSLEFTAAVFQAV